MAPPCASSAYWLALTVIAIVQLDTGEIFSLSGFFTYYCFGQVYSPETALGGIPQAWTLCVEVAFYAFLPIWALGMRRLPGRGRAGMVRAELVALACLFAASVAYKVVLVQLGALDDPELGPYMLSLPPFLDQFALGMALAVLSVWYADREQRPAPLRLVGRRPGVAQAGALLALLGSEHTRLGLTGEFGEHVDRSEFFARHLLYAAVALECCCRQCSATPSIGPCGASSPTACCCGSGSSRMGSTCGTRPSSTSSACGGTGRSRTPRTATWWLTGTAATIVVADPPASTSLSATPCG